MSIENKIGELSLRPDQQNFIKFLQTLAYETNLLGIVFNKPRVKL